MAVTPWLIPPTAVPWRPLPIADWTQGREWLGLFQAKRRARLFDEASFIRLGKVQLNIAQSGINLAQEVERNLRRLRRNTPIILEARDTLLGHHFCKARGKRN